MPNIRRRSSVRARLLASICSAAIALQPANAAVIDYADASTDSTPYVLTDNSTQLQVLTGAATQAGAISESGGSFGLEKTGWGTLTLTGVNSYTGGTTVSGGVLQLGDATDTAAILGAVSVGAGGALDIVKADTSGLTSILNAGTTYFRNDTSAGSATITNNLLLYFENSSTAGSATITSGGVLHFRDASGAGSATITSNNVLEFYGTSSAGNAAITNNNILYLWDTATAGSAAITNNSALFFFNTSTAGSAAITNNGILQFSSASTAGSATIDNYSALYFFDTGTAGSAAITNSGTALTDFSGSTGPLGDGKLSAGSIAGSGSFVLGANELTVGGNGLSTTVSGEISGAGGSLVKAGGGTLTLAGVNSYTGGTTISGGVLNVSADANLGGANGGLTLSGGTLQFGASFDLAGTRAILVNNGTFDTDGFDSTIRQGISGSGLTKAGAGTLTLSGANTYTGATNIDGGTLKMGVNNALSTSTVVSVASGAIFDLAGSNQAISALRGAGDVLLGNGQLQFGLDNSNTSFSGTMTGDGLGILRKAGSGTFTLNGSIDLGASAVASDWNTYSYLAVDGGTLAIGGTGSAAVDYIQNFGLITNAGTITASGILQNFGSLTNDGTIVGATQNFGAITNNGTMDGLSNLSGAAENTGTINGYVQNYASFTNTGTGIVNGYLSNFGTMLLEGQVNGYVANVISGATVTLTGTVTGLTYYQSFANAIFNLDGHSATVTSLYGEGEIKLGAGTLTVDTGNYGSFSGVISGSGALVKDGTGILTLSGVNTYGGGTTVAGGTLRLENSSAAGTGAITTTGSVIDYADGVDIANTLIISSDATQLNVSTGATATQSGFLQEDASPRPLEKTGGGTLIVAAASNSGTTTISNGTWQAASALAFSGNSAHVIAAGATLDMNGSDQVLGSLAGGGTVTSSAAGNVTLIVGNFGSHDVGTVFAGGIEDGAGTVGLMVDGSAGTFILSGNNRYTGDTVICDCSTLQIGNGGTTGAITSNVINNNSLIFNRSDDYNFGYTISDGFGSAGRVTQIGSGVLTLSAINGYSGGTVISSGTIRIADDANLGDSSGAVTLSNGGALRFASDMALNAGRDIHLAAGGGILDTGGHAVTVMGDISGGNSLSITGGGVMSLAGLNTYSGGTLVGNGTVLAISDDSNLGDTGSALTLYGGILRADGPVTLDAARDVHLSADGGTLDVNGNGIAVDGNIQGAGRLTIMGGGVTAGGGYMGGGGFSSVAALFGSNDHVGGTTIDDTLVVVLDSTGLGAASAPITLRNQGGIVFLGPATLESTRTITLDTDGGILAFDSLQIDSRITGSGSLTLLSVADLTLTGINDYTGGTLLLGAGANEFFISDDRNLGAASGALAMSGAILGFDASVTMSGRESPCPALVACSIPAAIPPPS